MPRVQIDGVGIYYESHGEGFPLVLTYGLGGNASMWADQIPAFADQYRCIVWDPRGHGGSESPAEPEQYGVQRSAEDLYGLLNHLEIERAFIGGLSMGGGIAARFAIAHPERVEALMILDSNTASGTPLTRERREVREKTIALCEAGDMDAVADYFLQANTSYHLVGGDTPAARKRLHRMIFSLDPTGFANTLRAMLRDDFPTERLGQITAPTLVLAGEQDPALEAVRLTHRTIPGAVLKTIANAGHLSNLDQPKAFERHILDFLHDASPSSGV